MREEDEAPAETMASQQALKPECLLAAANDQTVMKRSSCNRTEGLQNAELSDRIKGECH